MQPALRIVGLSKSFLVPRAGGRAADDPRRRPHSRRRDRFDALTDVTFDVAAGETIGLVGANGSGKSTLLKILAGVMTADGGRFEARGRVGALLELGAGFHPDLTGLENVYLNGALLGLSTLDVDRLLPEIIEFAGLERFMDMPVRHFSSGMASRLGFAVATRLAPEILLMDETFATGDAQFRARALAHVATMKRSGHTLLLVSHNMEIVLGLCDRVVWLDRGRVERIGLPAEVIAEYQRNQQAHLHEGGDRIRAALGLDSLFLPVAGGTPARIAEARLQTAGGEAGCVSLRRGESLVLELTIECAGDGPPLVVETAWVRADQRIVAQGRTRVEATGGGRRVVRLTWDEWPLSAGEYRLAAALRDATGDPRTTPYLDRRLDCGAVTVLDPIPADLPPLTRLTSQWQV